MRMDIRNALDYISDLESTLNEVFGCSDIRVDILPCDTDDCVWLVISKPTLPDIEYLCSMTDGSWSTLEQSVALNQVVYDWVAEYM